MRTQPEAVINQLMVERLFPIFYLPAVAKDVQFKIPRHKTNSLWNSLFKNVIKEKDLVQYRFYHHNNH